MSGLPASKLFGDAPSGLNTDGKSGRTLWAMVIHAVQEWVLRERIRRIYPPIAAHLYRNLAHILGDRLKDTTQKIFV